MKAASCFSGIGGAELALPEAEWVWSADIEPFPNAIRAHRFLRQANLGDVLAEDFIERARSFGPLDLLAGGPPCQDFSVAGMRAGLDGARGNLTLRWAQIIHELRPVWTITENVPGWLSVNSGHAFGAFLAALVGSDTALIPPKQCGGRWTDAGMVAGPVGRAAWRIIDAQYFGLAQRRRRVFVVFCFGNERDPSEILFEREDLSPIVESKSSQHATQAFSCVHSNPYTIAVRGRPGGPELEYRQDGNANAVLTPSGGKGGVGIGAVATSTVRRLTPLEAERLQGFPDNWTDIEYRGKSAADGPRYKAIGNAWAVPCARWIAQRIAKQNGEI